MGNMRSIKKGVLANQQSPQGPDDQATPESGGITGVATAVGKGQEQELPPKVRKELQGYKVVLDNLMHSEKTRKQTLKLLSGGDKNPEMNVPATAVTIAKQADSMGGDSRNFSQEVKLAGAVYLVADLLSLGVTAGYWPEPSEQQAAYILQDTLQEGIEAGLKDGSIDPIKLQQDVEPLMTPEQKKAGAAYAINQGIPIQADEMQMAYNSAGQMDRKKKARAAQQPAGQGQPQPAPQQQPQGQGVLG